MRYPYERFLRYLVSRKANVHRALERIGLPPVGDLWAPNVLARMCAESPPHIVKYLRAPRGRPAPHEGFLDWATRHEIGLLWREQPEFLVGEPSAAITLAGRLFFRPATRAVVGMLLLSEVSHNDISQIMTERFRIEVAGAALSTYQTLYWDSEETSGAFWQDVLARFAPEERQLYAHGLRWPPLRLEELRQVIGLENDDDPRAALRETLAIAKQGLREAVSAPIPEYQSVFKWAALVERTAAQILKGTKSQPKDGEVPDRTSAFDLFSVTVDKMPIPTLAELQGELPETPGGSGRK